jgi:hypothetical protein
MCRGNVASGAEANSCRRQVHRIQRGDTRIVHGTPRRGSCTTPLAVQLPDVQHDVGKTSAGRMKALHDLRQLRAPTLDLNKHQAKFRVFAGQDHNDRVAAHGVEKNVALLTAHIGLLHRRSHQLR